MRNAASGRHCRTAGLAVVLAAFSGEARAAPSALPPGLERTVEALTAGDALPGGCEIPSARIESYAIEIELQCGAESGALRLTPLEGASADHEILKSASFSMVLNEGASPAMLEVAAKVAARVASRDKGTFFKHADELRQTRAASTGVSDSIAEARPLGLLDDLRRALTWIVLMVLIGWLVVPAIVAEARSPSGWIWLAFLAAVFAFALVIRVGIPPWAPLHANNHGIAELRGLASAPSLWRGPVETDRYGPAYRQIVRAIIGLWDGRARSAMAFAAIAAAATVIPLAVLARSLTGSRLVGGVAALGLAVHPIHIAVSGSESPTALAGLLFLAGLALLCAVPTNSTRQRAAYWAGALALAACGELGVAPLALPMAALLVAAAQLGPRLRNEWRLWLGPLAVLIGSLALHVASLWPVLRDAQAHRAGGVMEALRTFRGTRDALLDPTLSAPTLLPMAILGLVVLLVHRWRIALALAAASAFLLVGSALVNGCRTDAIRYQTDAHLLLFVTAAAVLLLLPASIAWARVGGALVCALLLLLPAYSGANAIHKPLLDAAAYRLLERGVTRLPSRVTVHLAPRRMAGTFVLNDFPEYVLQAAGKKVTVVDAVPDRASDGCYVWLGPSCYAFTGEEVAAKVPDRAIHFDFAPLRQECEALVSHIDSMGIELGAVLGVPFAESEFHHLPRRAFVGLLPCAAAWTPSDRAEPPPVALP